MTAMKEEIKSLHERKVWNLIDLPKGCQTVKERWIYAMKSDGYKKAQFVAKGFTQVFEIDYKIPFYQSHNSKLHDYFSLWQCYDWYFFHNGLSTFS